VYLSIDGEWRLSGYLQNVFMFQRLCTCLLMTNGDYQVIYRTCSSSRDYSELNDLRMWLLEGEDLGEGLSWSIQKALSKLSTGARQRRSQDRQDNCPQIGTRCLPNAGLQSAVMTDGDTEWAMRIYDVSFDTWKLYIGIWLRPLGTA
jgi:hypothetical protein